MVKIEPSSMPSNALELGREGINLPNVHFQAYIGWLRKHDRNGL